MAVGDVTALTVARREAAGSRAARRLRRKGNVLGVIYGGGDDPVAFQVGERDLRHALAHAGAVIELKVGDAKATPVVVKELARHPVNGAAVHLDLLRVRLDQEIESTVVLELVGGDESPGVKVGGVLEQITRELTIQALPGDIPDMLEHDASEMEIGDTLTLAAVKGPRSVTFLDDPETVIASLTAPRLQIEDDTEIEQETQVVGEGEGDDAAAEDGSGDEDSSE